MVGARKRLLLGALVLIFLTTAAATGLAQANQDPRNISEDYYDAVDDALCMAHHEDEGFRPVDLSLVNRYSMLPIGEPVDLEVRMRNPWLHQVLDLSVTINTTDAPDIEVITGDRPPNLENDNVEATLKAGASNGIEEVLPVQENASLVRVYADLLESGIEGTIGQDPPQVHVAIEKRSTFEDADTERAEVALDKDTINKQGFGAYTARIWVTSGAEGLDQEYKIRYGLFVNYNATTETEFTFFSGDAVALREGESFTFKVPVIIHGEGENLLDFRGQVRTNFNHPPGTNAADDGTFLRFTSMRVEGGDQLVLSQGAAGPVTVGANVDVVNLFTRIIGFVSIFLVPVSMVTGGLFGKKSRRWLNNVTGGAKKRVLWHSAMSWIILSTASIHFLLALVEKQFTWDKGLFWGGVGWALLVSLGVTGYYQVRMIKRWNYKTWRYIHLGTAIGVFVFGVLHTFIDGSDLSGVRDTTGFKWLQWLIWP